MSLNNLIIPFDNLLDTDQKDSINAFVSSLNFSTNPSFVFNKKKQENEVDPEVRKSKTCFSNDKALLSFINENILGEMNKRLKGSYTFKLARDYVTFIRYDKGDFFDWHTDFEKIRVNHGENGFKEMHFLYCVQGCLDGGQLLIKKDSDQAIDQVDQKDVEDPKLKSNVTVIEQARISNSAVVFDKLLEHKGAEVIEGVKIIMTIDLYVLSEARVQANLSQELETELSDLLAGKRHWVSLRGDTNAFNKVLSTIDPKSGLVPFVELKADIRGDKYRIFGCSNGISYISIERERQETDFFEYREKQWYYSNERKEKKNRKDKTETKIKNKKKFTLRYQEPVKKSYNDFYNRRGYSDYSYSSTPRNYERERYDEAMKKLADTFHNYENNPCDFLSQAINELTMGEDDGGIDGYPNVPFLENDKKPWHYFRGNKLPVYFFDAEFEDWGFSKKEAGYSYHCNEPNYDQFDVNFRYGLMRSDSELLESEADKYSYVSSEEENEEEEKESDDEEGDEAQESDEVQDEVEEGNDAEDEEDIEDKLESPNESEGSHE